MSHQKFIQISFFLHSKFQKNCLRLPFRVGEDVNVKGHKATFMGWSIETEGSRK